MQRNTPGYIAQEFQNDTLQGLSVNSILILDTAGKITYFKQYDLVTQREISVPLADQQALASDPWVRQAQSATLPASGIKSMAHGPVLIAACPILTSQRKGPIRGVVVMTRNLDQRRIERLKTETRSSLIIIPFSSVASAEVPSTLEHMPIMVKPLNDQLAVGYQTLNDIQGKPILELELESNRSVFTQGVESLHYFLGALCIASLAFGAVSLLLLRYAVIARVVSLSGQVHRIADQETLSARVVVRGSDELGHLGSAINEMIEALQKSDSQFRNITENIHQVFWVKDAATDNRIHKPCL